MSSLRVVFAVIILFPVFTGFSWLSGEEQASKDTQAANNSQPGARVERTAPDLGLQSDYSSAPVSGKSSSTLQELKQLNRTLKTIETAAEAESTSLPRLPRSAGREGIEISRLQKQIGEILQVNERLKVQHEEQLVQIRKITEQAAIHRRMLDELDKKESRLEQVSTADMDEVLRQEKLRLIQQETEKNEDYVNQITTRQSPNARVS